MKNVILLNRMKNAKVELTKLPSTSSEFESEESQPIINGFIITTINPSN